MFSTWRRRILIALLTVLVGLSIPVGLEYYARSKARADLEKIIAELDRADPRWRLEDIEADRQPVPADKNSANTVIAVHRLLPKNWKPKIAIELEKMPPPITLQQDQADQLASELKPLEAALRIARKLKDQPNGRFKIEYSLDYLRTLVPDQHKVREVAILLGLDVAQFLHRKEMDKAWSSTQALLNAGRSLGDEPFLISTFVRMARDEITVRSLERTLAQAEFQQTHLEERQTALGEEIAVPHFLIGMRGERAGMNHMLSNIEIGKISLLQTLENAGRTNPTYRPGLWDPINEFFAFSMVFRSHATLLDLQTRVIEALKLPPNKRNEVLREIDSSFNEISPQDKNQILTRLLFPSVGAGAQAEQSAHTHLGCAISALGAERFRLKKNRWPESLEEIVRAGYLKKIPIDFFDGNLLRFRRTKDGLVIYSIGPDGNYDGKALDDLRNIDESVIRVEFRLWDLPHRRQAPLPPKAKE